VTAPRGKTGPALVCVVAWLTRSSAAALAVAVLFCARPLDAGGLDFDLVGARAIGRAGATAVSGDGPVALVRNPAGLARSGSLRLQLGISMHDDDASFRAPNADVQDSPTVADRSSPALAPSLAVLGGLGPVVLGAALLELGHLDRRLPAPEFGQQASDVNRLFPHRYGGLELSYRRRVAVVGAAARIGEWLGVGLSLGASDVEVGERRHIWAGFAGRDQLVFPTRDLDLAMSGRDRLVPFASAGLLIAPSLPIELGVALSWSDDANAEGDAALGRIANRPFPEPLASGVPAADLRLGMPTALRGGARYLGERVVVEVNAELTWFTDAGKVPAWRIDGVSVRDDTGQVEPIQDVASLVAQRDHATVRGAVDVEVVQGLLWLTAGYAHAARATGASHVSPGFGDLAGHTVSMGAEGTWNQIAFALGIARRFSPSLVVGDRGSQVEVENPFDAGTASAGAGRHSRAHDAVGLTMEIAWE
jgi:hypothetical protein